MAKTPTSTDELPIGEPVLISPDELSLDADNPRLILTGSARPTEESIIRQLHREGELSELLHSIAANGYLDFEPLVVFRVGAKGRYTVLEGNRRLAAVKLFRSAELAAKLEIGLPSISKELLATLERVRVIRVASRKEARTFIAFKHINGPHRWDSYAKAKYAASWYKEEKQEDASASLSDIAERIGDRHDTIKRMVGAIYVLDQAEEKGIFSVDDRMSKRFPFSHLYTALSRAEYMDYLGLTGGWSKWDPKPNPIPEDRLEQLRDVLRWIFGYRPDNAQPVVLSQNPDIKRLGEVLKSRAALAILREEKSLIKAFEQTTPPEELFSGSLVSAQKFLRQAVASLQAYDGTDRSLLDIAGEMKESAEILHTRMHKKFEAAQA